MVDNFSIGLSHLLLALMLWRLFNNPALEQDGAVAKRGFRVGFGKRNRDAAEQDEDTNA